MIKKIPKFTQIKKVTEETDNQYYDEDDFEKVDNNQFSKTLESKLNIA